VNAARTWVFPILRLIVFAVIAVALVKVAFFAETAEAAPDPTLPTGQIVEPQIAAALGTVKNDVTLTGSVAADTAVPIKATLAGEVRKLLVSPGQHVDAGTPVLTLVASVPAADGTVTAKTVTVTAPAAGTLSSFPTLVGQMFAVGDPVGQIAPPTFHVSGSLPPAQLYRLVNQPTEAQVTITGGPAPFACTSLTITSPLAGAVADGGEVGESAGGTGPTVQCAVPADVTVFPGLAANLVIGGGTAENVLIVPVTAVDGLAGTGRVHFVLDDGTTEVRDVTLGINDGINVEVLTGLADGEEILQFIPGADAVVPIGCQVQPDGSEICTDVGR
jgi:macrolide-specific efflux system membrane fusion protein